MKLRASIVRVFKVVSPVRGLRAILTGNRRDPWTKQLCSLTLSRPRQASALQLLLRKAEPRSGQQKFAYCKIQQARALCYRQSQGKAEGPWVSVPFDLRFSHYRYSLIFIDLSPTPSYRQQHVWGLLPPVSDQSFQPVTELLVRWKAGDQAALD